MRVRTTYNAIIVYKLVKSFIPAIVASFMKKITRWLSFSLLYFLRHRTISISFSTAPLPIHCFFFVILYIHTTFSKLSDYIVQGKTMTSRSRKENQSSETTQAAKTLVVVLKKQFKLNGKEKILTLPRNLKAWVKLKFRNEDRNYSSIMGFLEKSTYFGYF